jgi:hypothetical protein
MEQLSMKQTLKSTRRILILIGLMTAASASPALAIITSISITNPDFNTQLVRAGSAFDGEITAEGGAGWDGANTTDATLFEDGGVTVSQAITIPGWQRDAYNGPFIGVVDYRPDQLMDVADTHDDFLQFHSGPFGSSDNLFQNLGTSVAATYTVQFEVAKADREADWNVSLYEGANLLGQSTGTVPGPAPVAPGVFYPISFNTATATGGQTLQIRFSAGYVYLGPPELQPNRVNVVFYDNLSVLQVVPEPASLTLIGAGMLALIWRCRRASR